MTENFDLIFGQSASSQYAWSDSDYQNGWQTVGSTPPTAEQFDALQRRSDTKAKDLNNRLSPLETTASKALARVTPAANMLPYFNSGNSATTTAISNFIKTLLDDGDAATARATLGAPSTTGANASGSWNINAATATKLATARTIALSGDATGSATFDGSGNATIATTLAREVGLTNLIPDNAGAHNAVYRGKSLGSSVTSAQWTAIGSGTFRDLFIGDYWTIGGVNWRIAAFDYWLHCGGTKSHHVVIVPDTNLAECKMNSTDTTAGGYVGSDFYTGANGNTGKATAVTVINNAFGSSHILSHRELLTNAVTNGKPTGVAWYDSTVELMNEAMVYGAHFFEPNPNGVNPWNVCNNSAIDKAQLPLFAHDQSRICTADWWLRGVVSPAYFAVAAKNGQCSCNTATCSFGVRPAFGIKQS